MHPVKVLEKFPGIINLMKTKDDRKSWVRIPLSASKTGKRYCSPRSYSRKKTSHDQGAFEHQPASIGAIPGDYKWQKITLPLDGGYGARSGFEEV
jgi:hypothetical protein